MKSSLATLMTISTCLLAAISWPAAAYAQAPCATSANQVAYWPLDSTPQDVVGVHTGTLVGGATFAAGRVGQALSLDGNSGYLAVPDSDALNPASAITVATWIKPTVTSSGFPPIVKKNGPSDAAGYALELHGATVGFFVFNIGEVSGVPVPIGQWTHVAATYDGLAIHLYVNGALAASQAASGQMTPSQGELHIGHDPVLNRYFEGLIDEVGIFSSALSAAEVQAIYVAAADCGHRSTGLQLPTHVLRYNTSGTLVAWLFHNGEPLPGKPLEFFAQGASLGAAVTDSTGRVQTPFPASTLSVGSYTGALEVRFAGDAEVLPQTAQADLVISPYLPTITWPKPLAIVPGTALSSVQLNATVDAPGTLEYDPPLGTVLDFGFAQALQVTFVPADLNVTSASAWQYIDVNEDRAVAIGRISAGSREWRIKPTVDSVRNLVYVSDLETGSIVVAEGTTGATTRTIPLSLNGTQGAAGHMALDQARNRLYVADEERPLLWVLEPGIEDAVVQIIPVPETSSHGVEFNPSTGLLYLVGVGAVSVIDPAAPEGAVTIPGCYPESLAINPTTNLVYVGGTFCAHVRIIDGDPQRATFNTIVGAMPNPSPWSYSIFGVVVDRRSNLVYSQVWGDMGDSVTAVAVFDGDPQSGTFNELLKVIPLPRTGQYDEATGIAVDTNRGRVYVRTADHQGMGEGSVYLTAVDVTTDTVISLTRLPSDDQGGLGQVAVNPNTGRVYVSSARTNVTNIVTYAGDTTLATATSPEPVMVASSQVSLTFAAVTGPGETTIEELAPAAVSPLPGGFQIAGGQAFEISTTANVVSPIHLCFDASWVTDSATFASLAVLHGENGVWVDRTVSRDFATTTVCASVASLSPFVIARYIEPSYGIIRLYDSARSFRAGSSAPVRLQVTDVSGANVSSAALSLHATGLRLMSTSASAAVVDAGKSNGDLDFRFDAGIGGSGGYIFNLKTTGLATGSYELQFTIGGGRQVYSVPVQIR